MYLLYLSFIAQLISAAPTGDLPQNPPGTAYLPDKAIVLGIKKKEKERERDSLNKISLFIRN